jgi:hypothetical protein
MRENLINFLFNTGDGRVVQRVETEVSGITSSSVRRRCERSPGKLN